MTAVLFIFAVLFCAGFGGFILFASFVKFYWWVIPLGIILFVIAYANAKGGDKK